MAVKTINNFIKYISKCKYCTAYTHKHFMWLTGTNDSLNADAGGVYFFSKITNGLIWVLVGMWMDVGPTPWQFDYSDGKQLVILHLPVIVT